MDLSPERQEEILQILVQRQSVRKEQLVDCRRLARQRQAPGKFITALDILVEMGQVTPEEVQALDRQCGAAPPPPKPAMNPMFIGVGAVAVPILLLLAWMAFRERPTVDQGTPTNLNVTDFDPSVAKEIEDAKHPKATATELERDRAAKEFAEKQAKKHATVGRAPTLGPGLSGFASDKSKLKDKQLTDYFVPFSFAYPSAWKVTSAEGLEKSAGYVLVEHKVDGPEGGSTVEFISVGPFWVLGADRTRLKQAMPKAAEKIAESLFAKYPGFKMTREGDMNVGSYAGYGQEGEGTLDIKPAPIKFWIRFVLIPPGTASQQYGLLVTTMATGDVSELKSIDDLGAKGDLAAILASFAIGG